MHPLIGGLLLFAASEPTGGIRAAMGLAFGAVVGFSLGLTGGGGSIFAVPLLVYGLSTRPREAIGVSLAAVGATALVGGLRRLSRGEVEVRTGLLVAGMAGAPVGSWLGGLVPEGVLLVLFAALMLAVAARMWRQASRRPEETRAVRAPSSGPADDRGPSCRRDPEGRLTLTSRCFVVLAAAGLTTGALSGLFGVGGGFVIVPALVLVAGMGIHRAVATSLLVIALVSASAVASYVAAGRPLPPTLTALFVAGGIAGMEIGTLAGRRLAGPGLQKLFASAMVAVAAFIILKSLV
ncbi:sulfite exporter TauE/SafE family protein [Planctomyces sp. SH-PL62]|uniref:sulfite exporter TauE/SafE family protein n=1 Tax=Planctomyces sp. SH-PL62 TaxID=1636152 RepID=UPI00078DAD18|nr:sulfite exporter TauE/SafE family protein [Planctomyces sp. SH-PL62]AMV38751.1 Sulfite exporter TauE/SafE [Planctomyces sp. SH-PL62]